MSEPDAPSVTVSGARGPALLFPLLAVLLVMAVLAAATAAIVQRSVDRQNAVRAVARANVTALTLQLDEETGVRAYISTKSTPFLEPYDSARRALPLLFRGMQEQIRRLDEPGVHDDIEKMQRLNGTWLARFAEPSVAAAAATITEQRHGKELVDAFRAAQLQVGVKLDAAIASSQADAQRRLIYFFVFIGILVAAGIALPFSIRARQQALLARQADLERTIAEERSIVARLQEAFSGRQLVKTPSVLVDAVYAPASKREKVGGDWYDTLSFPDGRVFFSIGDVSGHGVNAAITMSRARQIILASAIDESDPGRILAKTNTVLHLQGEELMLTAQCGFIEAQGHVVQYASAGHPPPVLAYPDGRTQFLAPGGVPIGFEQRAAYTTHRVVAEPRAMLVCYTDGLTEFGRDIIAGEAALLREIRTAMGLERPAAAIFTAITAAHEPGDDVAVLTISFTPGTPATETTWQRESGTSGPRPYAETSTSVVAPNSPENSGNSSGAESRSSTWRRSGTPTRRRSRSW